MNNGGSSIDRNKIAVLSSGGGGLFSSLVDAQKAYHYEVLFLIVDRACGAIEKAHARGVSVIHKEDLSSEVFFTKLDSTLEGKIDLLVLAGFMRIVPPWFCQKWKGRIVNCHPSLLPKFGGRGMYGVKVHEAVIRAGEAFTGATVHYVTADIDSGEIVVQKSIEVIEDESAWALGGRIHELEKQILPEGVSIVLGRLRK